MKNLLLLAFVAFTSLVSAQITIYVNPDATSNGAGTEADPYGDIAEAVTFVESRGGGEVLILPGTYDLTAKVEIGTAASEATAVTIKPAEGLGSVAFNFGGRIAFDFNDQSRYITLEGVEIDGNTDENDFWCVVAEDFWSIKGNPDGGGLAVILDGEYITIRDCYLHDCYQKGVEIRGGRYVVVEGNIIQNIAHNSLSGGHGIMRQQQGREFFTDDRRNVFRWDLRENLIFNVEQRIYSWVPAKGFIDMVIDEGKSILIDDPKDSDGVQERMSARIKSNVIAFGAVDHVRLKSTPNLTVSNNSIYSEGENGDGITDKVGDTDTPQFTNFVCENNATQVSIQERTFGIEVDDCIKQTTAAGGVPVINNNYSVGKIKPKRAGITRLGDNVRLFNDPNNGDFGINPALGLTGVGVEPAILAALDQKGTTYGVSIGWDGWLTDNLRLTQTILDNIPGIDDGVAGNETVLTDDGERGEEIKAGKLRQVIHFHVAETGPAGWKTSRRSADEQTFELGTEYADWLLAHEKAYAMEDGSPYERVRYGDAEVKQNRVFKEGWLTVSAISPERTTLLHGYDNSFTLNGDLLVEFNGVTPQIGDSYDLMEAGSITGANGDELFNRVLFPTGQEPDNYTLEVVREGGRDILRLTIVEALPVELLSFTGEVIGKHHQLRWETTFESDNDFFEVQRSAAGGEWLAVGRVAATEGAATGSTYAFTDVTPLAGTNLYRLRQVDTDGTVAFSGVVQLEGAAADLRIFPNPATKRFTVVTSAARQDLRIVNALGQDVTQQVRLTATADGFRVNCAALPTGVYLVDTGNGVRKVDVRR